MMILNLIICFIPAFFTLLIVAVHCTCLDNLPKNAFDDSRFHRRWGLVFLVVFLVALTCSTYLSVDTIQTQYPL